jgi:excisionase family DNA binding protein
MAETSARPAQPASLRVTARLLTAREVAEMVGVRSAETVLRWTREGKLPAIRLPGGALRYRESDLEACCDAWLTTRRANGARD